MVEFCLVDGFWEILEVVVGVWIFFIICLLVDFIEGVLGGILKLNSGNWKGGFFIVGRSLVIIGSFLCFVKVWDDFVFMVIVLLYFLFGVLFIFFLVMLNSFKVDFFGVFWYFCLDLFDKWILIVGDLRKVVIFFVLVLDFVIFVFLLYFVVLFLFLVFFFILELGVFIRVFEVKVVFFLCFCIILFGDIGDFWVFKDDDFLFVLVELIWFLEWGVLLNKFFGVMFLK